MTLPEYTQMERRIDGIVHVLGLGAAVVAVAVLLHIVIPTRDVLVIVSVTIYSAGLVTIFGFSAAYNLILRPDWKETFRRYDHVAIFLMIAGTYTPFALISIGSTLGLGLLALVWLIAIFGVLIKLLRPRRFERVTLVLYLALGWIGLPAVGPLVAALSVSTLVLLAIGGVLYTIGVAFHLWETLPYQNAIWHAFVLAAAGCHYMAVLDVVVAK